MGILKDAFSFLASQPLVYDALQTAAGANYLQARLARHVASLPAPHVVLDVGGGTGLLRKLFGEDVLYLCLDLDPQKLGGFVGKGLAGAPLLGDATRMPLADAAVDLALCNCMSHHLDDGQLPRMLREIGRVLKKGGHLLFLDPVWRPGRWPGRILWRYDRGSHPRPPELLRLLLSRDFDIQRWERIAIFHEYALCVATPR